MKSSHHLFALMLMEMSSDIYSPQTLLERNSGVAFSLRTELDGNSHDLQEVKT